MLLNFPLKLVQHPMLALLESHTHTQATLGTTPYPPIPSLSWRLGFFTDSLPLPSAHPHCCSSEGCHRSPKHCRNSFSARLAVSTWLHTASLEALVFNFFFLKKADIIFWRLSERLHIAFKEKSTLGAGNVSMSPCLIPALSAATCPTNPLF